MSSQIRYAAFFFIFTVFTILFLQLRLVVQNPDFSIMGEEAKDRFEGELNVTGEVEVVAPKTMSVKSASHLDLPSVIGARAAVLAFHSVTQSRSSEPVELAFYEDAALGRSSVKRVLIQIHGMGREAWVNWKQASRARAKAAEKSRHFSVKDVLVVAPMFFNGNDKERYRWSGKGSTGPLLVWKGNGWGDGESNQYPHKHKTVSSFEALDAMLLYYSDRSHFPNIESIVISGHSLGGQLVHRYSILSDLPLSSPVKLSFLIANPSTLLYTDGDRPRHKHDASPPKLIEGYNRYKYGLEGIHDKLGEYYEHLTTARAGGKALWARFSKERRVHYVNGEDDRGVGDERPQAFVQGKNRMDRLKNYIAWASSPERGGAWPARHTVEWAPGVEHDAGGILESEAGLRRAFLD
ncbi:unnamed protein product [Tilletia controversa]|uniref:AB hydrolase-1 domain-containing protein n=2 Tax=Tilletia TaxID=13289 RepID=A0A177VDE4_9BASI|nr:hypothetical protein CF336_g5399 [Tilletia laevis]KAE8258535.1 hypothetical protein A4X03_0g4346 [Tilletia caries]CAD6921503.1 unnamed protein product [Tilletia controversa]KAE8196913.1 hypothetical protein CF335_g4740 [Tilletia laevis]CAD6912704.1 unnamed protein product [Tilletia laevis]